MPEFSLMPDGIVNYESLCGISTEVHCVILVVLKVLKYLYLNIILKTGMTFHAL